MMINEEVLTGNCRFVATQVSSNEGRKIAVQLSKLPNHFLEFGLI